MRRESGGRLRPAEDVDPVYRLWLELPEPWRGPVIGPGIANWGRITENGDRRIDLTGLPDPFPAELAWMAHWQSVDGTRSTVLAMNQLANILRRAAREGQPFPTSMRALDWETASALQGWFYAHRWGRLPPKEGRSRLRVLFRFARQALIARCSDGPWWTLDEWHPRCDPRIPLSTREPQANYGCSPGQITQRWLREAVKWYLGTQLESGALRWTTVSQDRMNCLRRFDIWLTSCLAEPTEVLGDPAAAAGQADRYRRWAMEPGNRKTSTLDRRTPPKPAHPRLINDDIRAVADLFTFMVANRDRARIVTGSAVWDRVTDTHVASWFRQVSRIPHTSTLNDRHYVDDHALAQIPGALPLLGLPRDQQMTITRGDGTKVLAAGFDDPQAMRMILLQILTGRRSSEIRTCEFDCLSSAPDISVQSGQDQEVVRFRYAQSKIDTAPDTILVDREVSAVIEEQQRWVREHLPEFEPRHLSCSGPGTATATNPTRPEPTTGCSGNSATSLGSPTARAGNCN